MYQKKSAITTIKIAREGVVLFLCSLACLLSTPPYLNYCRYCFFASFILFKILVSTYKFISYISNFFNHKLNYNKIYIF
jgi:hypothetical protein